MIDGGDFGEADDIEYEPEAVTLHWRDRSGDVEVRGEEVVHVKPRLQMGILLGLETNDPRGLRNLFAEALVDDDHEIDRKTKEPKPGTSSRERFDALLFHPTREVPGRSLTNIVQGLYNLYTERRNGVAPTRPTGSPAPSLTVPSPNGRGSTGRRSAKAST